MCFWSRSGVSAGLSACMPSMKRMSLGASFITTPELSRQPLTKLNFGISTSPPESRVDSCSPSSFMSMASRASKS